MDVPRLLDDLAARHATLATAESLTGGRLAAAVTAVPGSSRVFVGAVVSYATRVKVDLLGVPGPVIDRHGVVSAECARAMARGARARLGADWALSTTGVAGPGPQDGVAAGTVYVGLAGPDAEEAVRLDLTGGRAEVVAATVEAALALLAGRVTWEHGPLG